MTEELEQNDIEAEARKLGWSPRENWRGRDEEFVEAAEFVRRGKEVLPIVRSQVEKTRAENEALKRQLADTKAEYDDRFKRTERMTQKLLEQQRTQMVAEFEAKKREAAAAGDTAAYDRVVASEQRAYAKMAEKDPEADVKPAATGQASVPTEVQEWSQRNPWFHRDAALAREAEGVHLALLQEAPGLPLAANLERVTETLKSRYPHKFGVTTEKNGRTFSAVEGSNSMRTGSVGSKERGWKELPQDVKDACDTLVAKGYLKGDVKTIQANYAKTYWADNND
jgi:hypothetical protein